jgi:hypothetical protein
VVFTTLLFFALLSRAGATTIMTKQEYVSDDVLLVHIYLEPTEPFKGWAASLCFNSTAMQAKQVIIGDIFEGDPVFFIPGEINNENGTILDMYGLIIGKKNVTDAGSLAIIEFTVMNKKAVALGLFDVDIANYSQMIECAIDNAPIVVDEKEAKDDVKDGPTIIVGLPSASFIYSIILLMIIGIIVVILAVFAKAANWR